MKEVGTASDTSSEATPERLVSQDLPQTFRLDLIGNNSIYNGLLRFGSAPAVEEEGKEIEDWKVSLFIDQQ